MFAERPPALLQMAVRLAVTCVIAGPDPAIHPFSRRKMDARVKPAHDEMVAA
jgi:hypothetical protein